VIKEFTYSISSEGCNIDALIFVLFMSVYEYYRGHIGEDNYSTAEVARLMGIKRTRLQMWMNQHEVVHPSGKVSLRKAKQRIEELEKLLNDTN